MLGIEEDEGKSFRAILPTGGLEFVGVGEGEGRLFKQIVELKRSRSLAKKKERKKIERGGSRVDDEQKTSKSVSLNKQLDLSLRE